MAMPHGCRWWASFGLLVVFAGCDPAGFVTKPGVAPTGAPPAPPDAPSGGVGVVLADEAPAGVITESFDPSAAAASALSGAASLLPNLTSDEAAIHRMFAENMAAARSIDGKRILDQCHPDQRSELIVGMAQMGYLFLGPESEVGRMVAEAGLLSDKYKPLFDDLNDHQIDSPDSRLLLEEAAAQIRDPARLVTLVREATVGRVPEATYELVNLTVEGDTAAGVCLVVTRAGTQANPFAAERIDSTWYAARPTPAALAKVKEYEADPIAATVKLPPRKEVRVTAEQLAAEFQADPHGASRKYGAPHGPMGPIGPGGPFGPFGPGGPGGPPPGAGGVIISAELPPPLPEHDNVLEGTVAYRMSLAGSQLVYLITPAGGPAVNLPAGKNKEVAAILAAAEPGQRVRAVFDAAMIALPLGEPGTISVSSRRVEIGGEPAEPFGPLAAADFFRELADPIKVDEYHGRPVILTGTAVMSQPQGMMVGLSDGGRGMVGCMLQASERKALQAVNRGQSITVRGTYIQPHGRNQIMLHGAVLVE